MVVSMLNYTVQRQNLPLEMGSDMAGRQSFTLLTPPASRVGTPRRESGSEDDLCDLKYDPIPCRALAQPVLTPGIVREVLTLTQAWFHKMARIPQAEQPKLVGIVVEEDLPSLFDFMGAIFSRQGGGITTFDKAKWSDNDASAFREIQDEFGESWKSAIQSYLDEKLNSITRNIDVQGLTLSQEHVFNRMADLIKCIIGDLSTTRPDCDKMTWHTKMRLACPLDHLSIFAHLDNAHRAYQVSAYLHHGNEVTMLWLLIWRNLMNVYTFQDKFPSQLVPSFHIEHAMLKDNAARMRFSNVRKRPDCFNPVDIENLVALYCTMVNDLHVRDHHQEPDHLSEVDCEVLGASVQSSANTRAVADALHKAAHRLNFLNEGVFAIRRFNRQNPWTLSPVRSDFCTSNGIFASDSYGDVEESFQAKPFTWTQPSGSNSLCGFDYPCFSFGENRAQELALSESIKRDMTDSGTYSTGLRVEDAVNRPPQHCRLNAWTVYKKRTQLGPFEVVKHVAKWAVKGRSEARQYRMPRPRPYVTSRLECRHKRHVLNAKYDKKSRIAKQVKINVPRLRGGGDRLDRRQSSSSPRHTNSQRSSARVSSGGIPIMATRHAGLTSDDDTEVLSTPSSISLEGNSITQDATAEASIPDLEVGRHFTVVSSSGSPLRIRARARARQRPSSLDSSYHSSPPAAHPLQSVLSPNSNQENVAPSSSPPSREELRSLIDWLSRTRDLGTPSRGLMSNRGGCHPCPVFPGHVHHVCHQLLDGEQCGGARQAPTAVDGLEPHIYSNNRENEDGDLNTDDHAELRQTVVSPFEILEVDASPIRPRRSSINAQRSEEFEGAMDEDEHEDEDSVERANEAEGDSNSEGDDRGTSLFGTNSARNIRQKPGQRSWPRASHRNSTQNKSKSSTSISSTASLEPRPVTGASTRIRNSRQKPTHVRARILLTAASSRPRREKHPLKGEATDDTAVKRPGEVVQKKRKAKGVGRGLIKRARYRQEASNSNEDSTEESGNGTGPSAERKAVDPINGIGCDDYDADATAGAARSGRVSADAVESGNGAMSSRPWTPSKYPSNGQLGVRNLVRGRDRGQGRGRPMTDEPTVEEHPELVIRPAVLCPRNKYLRSQRAVLEDSQNWLRRFEAYLFEDDGQAPGRPPNLILDHPQLQRDVLGLRTQRQYSVLGVHCATLHDYVQRWLQVHYERIQNAITRAIRHLDRTSPATAHHVYRDTKARHISMWQENGEINIDYRELPDKDRDRPTRKSDSMKTESMSCLTPTDSRPRTPIGEWSAERHHNPPNQVLSDSEIDPFYVSPELQLYIWYPRLRPGLQN